MTHACLAYAIERAAQKVHNAFSFASLNTGSHGAPNCALLVRGTHREQRRSNKDVV
jgi:hypothetical protein